MSFIIIYEVSIYPFWRTANKYCLQTNYLEQQKYYYKLLGHRQHMKRRKLWIFLKSKLLTTHYVHVFMSIYEHFSSSAMANENNEMIDKLFAIRLKILFQEWYVIFPFHQSRKLLGSVTERTRNCLFKLDCRFFSVLDFIRKEDFCNHFAKQLLTKYSVGLWTDRFIRHKNVFFNEQFQSSMHYRIVIVHKFKLIFDKLLWGLHQLQT